MSTLLLAPHPDDETLFAFYTMLREDADVLLVLDCGDERLAEFEKAMQLIGRTPDRWIWNDVSEEEPDWANVGELTRQVASNYDRIIAPAYETGGHEHHNAVALIAAALGKPVTFYFTYVRGHGRTVSGFPVIGSAAECELKRRAMDCYQSQIDNPLTAPWFESGWQVEFVEHF